VAAAKDHKHKKPTCLTGGGESSQKPQKKEGVTRQPAPSNSQQDRQQQRSTLNTHNRQ